MESGIFLLDLELECCNSSLQLELINGRNFLQKSKFLEMQEIKVEPICILYVVSVYLMC